MPFVSTLHTPSRDACSFRNHPPKKARHPHRCVSMCSLDATPIGRLQHRRWVHILLRGLDSTIMDTVFHQQHESARKRGSIHDETNTARHHLLPRESCALVTLYGVLILSFPPDTVSPGAFLGANSHVVVVVDVPQPVVYNSWLEKKQRWMIRALSPG